MCVKVNKSAAFVGCSLTQPITKEEERKEECEADGVVFLLKRSLCGAAALLLPGNSHHTPALGAESRISESQREDFGKMGGVSLTVSLRKLYH